MSEIDCEMRVAEDVDNWPALIGFIPLELLDFVVDSRKQWLLGNLDHGGEFVLCTC